jgi:hypothetical protein
MESINPNQVKNTSSFKVYTLAFLFLVLSVISVMPTISNFRENRGCEAYVNLAKEYNFPPSSCFQYSLQKYVIPAVAMISPFVFNILIILFKEKKKKYQPAKSKQEKIAFSLSVFASLTFLLSFILIRGIRCEGFGCLGLAPLVAASIGILPPLIFGFSLWFLIARYQWGKQEFLVVAIVQILLLIVAYIQTPLI